MPLATTHQYAEMLDRATEGGYALAAVNVTSSETLNVASRGFAEAGADGIVNLETAVGLPGKCSRQDVVLQVECGVVGGEGDGLAGPSARQGGLYTTPEDLLRVATVLGTGAQDRYLAIA